MKMFILFCSFYLWSPFVWSLDLPEELPVDLAKVFARPEEVIEGQFKDFNILFKGHDSAGKFCFVSEHPLKGFSQTGTWYVIYNFQDSKKFNATGYFKRNSYLFGNDGLLIQLPGNKKMARCLEGDGYDFNHPNEVTKAGCRVSLAMNHYRFCDFWGAVSAHTQIQFRMFNTNGDQKFVVEQTTLDLPCDDKSYKYEQPNGDCFE